MLVDIVAVLFACTCANHLGLVSAIERVLRIQLPVVNCGKCFTFWVTLVLTLPHLHPIQAVAVSFLNAYLAIWVELGMGCIDTLYNKFYDKIYSTKDNEDSPADDEDHPSDTMSYMQQDRTVAAVN